MIILINGKKFKAEQEGKELVGFVFDEEPKFPEGMFEIEINGEKHLVEPVSAYSEDGKYRYSFAEVPND